MSSSNVTKTPREVSWKWLAFHELSTGELYDVMQLRQQVFVVEQQCIYLDADGLDPQCIHGIGRLQEKLVAYARIIPAGLSYPEVSIGRVVSSPEFRGHGLGRKLMNEALREANERFPYAPITIGAQLYLQFFYESLGFKVVDEPYDEDGIMHVDMTLLT
jgi:ElaA protein